MRARSAITRGRSSGRSMSRACRPGPLANVLRAWSTREVTCTGSGDTDRVPVTMRPWSSRLGDQAAHAVGLIVDHPEELQHLGRVRSGRGTEHCRRRALDRDQRRSQLVAHDAQELGAHPLELLERRPRSCRVTTTDSNRVVVRLDRRRVDQGGHAPAIGDGERHFLGPHRLGGAQQLRDRELRQGRPPGRLRADR